MTSKLKGYKHFYSFWVILFWITTVQLKSTYRKEFILFLFKDVGLILNIKMQKRFFQKSQMLQIYFNESYYIPTFLWLEIYEYCCNKCLVKVLFPHTKSYTFWKKISCYRLNQIAQLIFITSTKFIIPFKKSRPKLGLSQFRASHKLCCVYF